VPNFDQFERSFRRALAGSQTLKDAAADISRLADENRPTFARNKTRDEIEVWLSTAKARLRHFLPNDDYFLTSDDNLSGKDLLGKTSKTSVELKSPDGKTDANTGVSSIEWALDDRTSDLTRIMKDSMVQRRKLWFDLSSNTERLAVEIDRSKRDQNRSLHDYFSSRLRVNDPVPDRLRHFAACVSIGLTKLREVKSSYETNVFDPPLLLVANFVTGLEIYEQSFKNNEEIITLSISQPHDGGRVTITILGTESGVHCRLYPHYKNSFKSTMGIIPANNWVKTPCFHVWIDS
jgi:hypothetical protein